MEKLFISSEKMILVIVHEIHLIPTLPRSFGKEYIENIPLGFTKEQEALFKIFEDWRSFAEITNIKNPHSRN